ncbi:substrate-binding domain-containing protein [Streptomyces sp. NPDC012466]|uniref:sugar ABC transporter substrate-binding protein n=1 Tax=Streptomyces sp. NPDC012466 TaxID=3364835 RepID=UPI0036E0C796
MTPPPYAASRRHFLALSAATALTAAGCSAPQNTAAATTPSSPSGGTRLTKIGFDYPFTQLPIYSALVKLSTAQAERHGISLLTTSDNASADTQATNLNTWVAREVPAIVSFPMVFEAAEPLAKAALDAGLIWVTYGGSLHHQSADIRFSFREGGTLLGAAAARWAQEHLGGKGKIAFLTDSTIELGRERTKGMIDAFTKAAPGVDVVAREQSIDPDTGLSKTKAILAKHPDLNLVLGVTDAAAYGAFKALQQAGRAKDDAKTFVGGQDGSAPSLLAVKQGTFYRASAALAPKDIAAAVVDVPRAVAAGKANPSAQVPITLVQRADTAEIDALLAQNA